MKLALLILYFGVMVGIGLYCRKHTSGINGFVLGGRSVGPWLTAFAYGTSYFFRCGLCGLCRAVWLEVRHRRHLGWDWQRHPGALCWPGLFWAGEPAS